MLALPFPAPELDGVSGSREAHNSTRVFFDAAIAARFPVCHAVNQAFLSPEATKTIADSFDIDLSGSFLRVEFAQDTDGFWLAPHTDLGVKLFTLLLYLSRDPEHRDLGTDLYFPCGSHAGQVPFQSNTAIAFTPSDKSFHGFERRDIRGVRKTIIINYVTREWRSREQLASPNALGGIVGEDEL